MRARVDLGRHEILQRATKHGGDVEVGEERALAELQPHLAVVEHDRSTGKVVDHELQPLLRLAHVRLVEDDAVPDGRAVRGAMRARDSMEPADRAVRAQLTPVAIPRRELFSRLAARARLPVGIVGMDAVRREARVGHDLVRLEAVDVAAAFAGVEHRALAGRRDRQAIDHAGHVGGHRLVALLALVQRVVGRAAGGDVGHGAEIAGQRTRAIEGPRAAAGDPAHRAVGALEAVLELEVASLFGRARPLGENALAIVGVQRAGPARAHRLRLGQTGETAPLMVDVLARPRGVGAEDPHRDRARELLPSVIRRFAHRCPASRQVRPQPERGPLTYSYIGI